MTDDHPQMSGGSAPAARDESLIQKAAENTDDVEMRILSDKQNTDGDKAPAIPPKDAGSDPSDEITEAKRSPKGKEKADIPPTPIEKIDPLAIESADAPTPSGPAEGPICNITLLLPTGARHPYRIDEKYLTKRSVEVPDLTEDGKKDPFSISIYKLKELILREWREDWEAKPASPTSIRLIHFGKLLEDKEMLKSRLLAYPLFHIPSDDGDKSCSATRSISACQLHHADSCTDIPSEQNTSSAVSLPMLCTCPSGLRR
jgi:hypothetical protein